MVVKLMKWGMGGGGGGRGGGGGEKKFQVSLTVHSLEGLPVVAWKSGEIERIKLGVKWKGMPKPRLGSLLIPSKSPKSTCTIEKVPQPDGVVTWGDHFEHTCLLTMGRNGAFHPWEVHFLIFQGLQQGTNPKQSVAGLAIMNLADFASHEGGDSTHTTKIHVTCSIGTHPEAALSVTVNFVELRTNVEFYDSVYKLVAPSLPCIGGPLMTSDENNNDSVNGQRNIGSHKKLSAEMDLLESRKLSSSSSDISTLSSDSQYNASNIDEGEDENVGEDDLNVRLSSSYGTLAGVNLMVEGALPYDQIEPKIDHYSIDGHVSILSKSASGGFPKWADESSTLESDQGASQPPTRLRILSWKKRKLSFSRSPRRQRGEPLLNKFHCDEGGDDIDLDRRLAGSSTELFLVQSMSNNNDEVSSLCLDFGEESFCVGSWEKEELVSRDRQMKLWTNVFFASIDQCNERAAGESACTVLVAVIADWLHRNPNWMPIKAEFDTLIREGSREWRQLCENEVYKGRFPDKHFDLETVLEAKVREFLVIPHKSYVGFFQLDGVGDTCDFLQGAMSFDNIWDEIVSKTLHDDSSLIQPAIYIVSWNDHFFILKVDRDAFYIIDTLGERLFEGCKQAYMICFDKETSLLYKPRYEKTQSSLKLREEDTSSSPQTVHEATNKYDNKEVQEEILYQGNEACKHFIKGFFAALPLRELKEDIKRGLVGETPLHQRLQIEFHFTSMEQHAP